ncbi:MAG: hypothetical protein OEV62_00115 [Actinomycetota bacterium]|nr:hypothetical protein [Actinomycetota bacterium]
MSVLDYGSLLEAVTAAAAGGFDLCIPENTTVTCSTALSNPAWPTSSDAWRGVTIRGHNRYTSKISFTATNGGAGTADVEPTLQHLTVELTAASRVELSSLTDCDVFDNHTTGVFFVGAVGSVNGYGVDRVVDCTFVASQNGANTNFQSATVANCTFIDTSSTGAGLYFDTAEVVDCQIRNYKTVSTSSNARNQLVGCRVEIRNVAGAYAILGGRVASCGFTGGSSSTFLVDSSLVSASTFSGSKMEAEAGSVLVGCVVSGVPSGSHSITVTTAGDVLISACFIGAQTSQNAIHCTVNAPIIVTGCLLSGSGGTGTGVNATGTAACVVVGNRIASFATTTSLPAGSVDANNI